MGYDRFSVVKRPYDKTLEYNISMYDKLPYKRDSERCNASTLALVSGNLVKYYYCKPNMEPKEVDTQDENLKKIISDHIAAEEEAYIKRHTQFPILFGPLENQALPVNEDADLEEESYDDTDLEE